MISLRNVSKQYGGKNLFQDISLHIVDGDRVALIGPNGAGKSTLMKIIVDQVEPDSGTITQSRFNTTGYLPQDGVYHRGQTLYEEVATVFKDLNILHKKIEEISQEIKEIAGAGETESSRLEELVEELGESQHNIEYQEGYNIEAKITRVLSGLGFTENDLSRMTEEFSGGWQMRIALAKLLLLEPAILLLDEPTNHLDMESLEWLETYLQSYSGSIVLVSHDSRFLDNLVGKIVEISMGKATSYTGNYSSCMKQKALRRQQLRAAYENQQKLIEKTTRFVERFRYKNTKAKQVQSRIKMLDKMERIEIEGDGSTISFDFPQTPRPGKIVMELNKLTKLYGNNLVFRETSLCVERGDKIAILGVNGSGKSTLARIIADIEPFQGGQRKQGHNVTISYYAQNMAEALDPDKTVLQTVGDVASSGSPRELRTLLGSFLFSGDDVFKPVSVLSGGEKSRLALAKMLLIPANLLVFDEPTNHLDTQSKTVLQRSLNNFRGSYIIVSHDRDFLAPLINKVIYLKDGAVDVYPGTVDDYLSAFQRIEADKPEFELFSEKIPPGQKEKETKRKEAKKRQDLYQKLKPLKDMRTKIEKEIAFAEERKTEIETAFADQKTYESEKMIQTLHIEYDRIASQLNSLYDKWADIEERIEA
jgi:ATP-binding cassette subfamily F protein 3